MIREIAERPADRRLLPLLEYDRRKQWDFGLEVAEGHRLRPLRGAGKTTPMHPFTMGISANDVEDHHVRQPTTSSRRSLRLCTKGATAIHDQGIPARFRRTMLEARPALGSPSPSRAFLKT